MQSYHPRARLAKAPEAPHTICRTSRVLRLHNGAHKVMRAKSNSGMLQQLGHMLDCCLYMMTTQNFRRLTTTQSTQRDSKDDAGGPSPKRRSKDSARDNDTLWLTFEFLLE